MNFFALECVDEMGGRSWFFQHPDKTMEQFEQDCQTLVSTAARQAIDDADYTVRGDDITRNLSKLLEVAGYIPIDFGYVSYSESSLDSNEDSEEWREVLGDDLTDAALAKSFHNALAWPRHDWFTTDGRVYHNRGCPILLAACGERVFGVGQETVDSPTFKHELCDVCNPT